MSPCLCSGGGRLESNDTPAICGKLLELVGLISGDSILRFISIFPFHFPIGKPTLIRFSTESQWVNDVFTLVTLAVRRMDRTLMQQRRRFSSCSGGVHRVHSVPH